MGHFNKSFISKRFPMNSVEMYRIHLMVLWTNCTHGLILLTLLFPEECFWNLVELCRMTFVELWNNFTHGFMIKTLLL